MDKEQLKKAVAEKAKDVQFHIPGKMHSAFAEVLVSVAEPNHLSLDLLSAFLPTVRRNPGEPYTRNAKRGRYPVRTMVPGAKHLTDVVDYQEQYVYAFDRLIAGTSHSVWEIQSGEVGTVEKMRTDLRADLFDEIVSKIFGLLTTVWNTTDTPNNFTDASSSGVTATALDNMIENILDLNGGVRAIVGTRRTLLPIYRFAQYREYALTGTGTDAAAFQTSAFDEFTKTGRVSTYLGVPLIEIPQIFRNALASPNTAGGLRDRLIPQDKILVIGNDAGEITLTGETVYQDYTDPTTQPANYVLHSWQDYGLILTNVEGIGVIKV